MISNASQLHVSDNSGAKIAQCINQSGKSWGIGDVITVSIKKAQPRSKVAAGQVRFFCYVFIGRILVSMSHDCIGREGREKVENKEKRSEERSCFERPDAKRRRRRPRPPLPLFLPSRPPPLHAPPPSSLLHARPHSLFLEMYEQKQYNNQQVHKAVITETAKETRRADGSALVFQRNACVLLNAKLQPLGSRVLGFATHELRARGLMKVLSLAARVI